MYFQLDAIQNNFTTDQKSESSLNYNILYFIQKLNDLGEVLKKLIHKINHSPGFQTARIWEALVPHPEKVIFWFCIFSWPVCVEKCDTVILFTLVFCLMLIMLSWTSSSFQGKHWFCSMTDHFKNSSGQAFLIRVKPKSNQAEINCILV